MIAIFNQYHDSYHGVTDIARIKLGSGDVVRVRPAWDGNILVVDKSALDSGFVTLGIEAPSDMSRLVATIRAGSYTGYFYGTERGLVMLVDNDAVGDGNVIIGDDESSVQCGGFRMANVSKLQGE